MEHYPSMQATRPSGKGRFLVLDSEAIGLVRDLRAGDTSSAHCIVVKDDLTNEVFVFFDPYEKRDPHNREHLQAEGTQDGYMHDGIKFLMEAECLIAQNISGYDALAFEKVFGKEWHFNYMEKRGKKAEREWYYPNKIMDTYVMSCVLNPERKPPGQAFQIGRGNVGPHSIEAHGIRIGRYKPDNEDWTKLTDHMLHRCEEDVHIGQDMYHYLMKEWMEQLERPNPRTGLSINTAYRCELQVAFAVARQAQRGFRFDTDKALKRVSELDAKIQETEDNFKPHMPLRLRKKKLAKPINGHTHGSYYTTCMAITKKLNAKAWCVHTGKPAGVTQKQWLIDNPIQQDNSIGEYSASVTKRFEECRGFITDHYSKVTTALPLSRGVHVVEKTPLVDGPFTPVEWEDIPLGNRDSVKQVLYAQGWEGINYNDTEQRQIDDGLQHEMKPWSGKIDEDSIDRWKERQDVPEWCEGIAAWYILNSRRNQILNSKDVEYYKENGKWPRSGGKVGCRGILPKCFNVDYCINAQDYYEANGVWPTDMDEEWRAPAEAFPCATNTFRMRHKVVVNIPSRGLYPLRDLFIAGKGKKVLGCDGAGLELRMLAHFMADDLYQEIVLSGDIHSYNQELAGLPLRDMAKTFIYAFLYGSGIANLAKVCGMTTAEMQKRVDKFKRDLPALSSLIDRIELSGEKYGHLLSVDGRWGRIRSRDGKLLVHTMLNVLLQMTGSLSMKYGLCFAERQMLSEGVGLDDDGFVAWLANVHDEMQMEVDETEVEEITYTVTDWKAEEKRTHIADGKMYSAPNIIGKVDVDGVEHLEIKRYYHRAGQIIAESLAKAGEFLQLRCPLAGEYMIGDSWADTH